VEEKGMEGRKRREGRGKKKIYIENENFKLFKKH
jgi:hypothetical protein